MEIINSNLDTKNYSFFLQLKDTIRSFDEIKGLEFLADGLKNLFSCQIFFNNKRPAAPRGRSAGRLRTYLIQVWVR